MVNVGVELSVRRYIASPTLVTRRMRRCYTKSVPIPCRPGTVAEFEERFAKRLPLRKNTPNWGAFGTLSSVRSSGHPRLSLRKTSPAHVRTRSDGAQDTALPSSPDGGDLIAAMNPRS